MPTDLSLLLGLVTAHSMMSDELVIAVSETREAQWWDMKLTGGALGTLSYVVWLRVWLVAEAPPEQSEKYTIIVYSVHYV